jgi:hypothetical protein
MCLSPRQLEGSLPAVAFPKPSAIRQSPAARRYAVLLASVRKDNGGGAKR